MLYSEATELAARIRYEYPQFSSVDVIPVRQGYAVVISRWEFRHDRYCCIEYKKFKQVAEAHGFETDLSDNGMLIRPIERTVTIHSPGQWALAEMIGQDISDGRAMQLLKRYDCPKCRYAA